MSTSRKGNPVSELPQDAPKAGDVYKHYKGDHYKVLGLAIGSTDQWVVVYEALYENPAAPMFVRPASEWHETVEWQGQKIGRFTKV